MSMPSQPTSGAASGKPKANDSTVLFILITAFLNLAGIGLIAPVLPAIVQQYVPQNEVDFTVAALVTAYSICQFIAVPTLGAMSDRYGRRSILLISLLGSALGYLVFGLGGALWVLYLGRIIDGLTGGNIAAIYAYAADITEPQERTKFFGKLGASAGFGFIFGPAIGGIIYSLTHSNSAPLYFAAAMTLVNTVWGYFAMPESLTPDKRSDSIPLARLNPFSQLMGVFKISELRLLLAGILLWTFAFAILQSNLGTFTENHLNWLPSTTSIIFFIIGTIGIIVQGLLIPRLLPRFGEANLAIIGMISLAIGFGILIVLTLTFQPALVFVGIIFTAVGNGLVTPTLTGLVSQIVGPREQGRVQGGNQSVQALARVLGPAWIFFVFKANDTLLSVPYISATIAIVVSIAMIYAAIPIIKAHREKTGTIKKPQFAPTE